jgi:hypothetical protein
MDWKEKESVSQREDYVFMPGYLSFQQTFQLLFQSNNFFLFMNIFSLNKKEKENVH